MSVPKVIIVSQHYPPDPSTTAGIMAEIAESLATERRVLVLSGMRGSLEHASRQASAPRVIEIPNRMPSKAALFRRAIAEMMFTIRAFCMVLKTARPRDVVLTVTAPFTLPYAVILA